MTENNKVNQIDEVYIPKGNPLPNIEIPDGTKILGEPENIDNKPLPIKKNKIQTYFERINNGI